MIARRGMETGAVLVEGWGDQVVTVGVAVHGGASANKANLLTPILETSGGDAKSELLRPGLELLLVTLDAYLPDPGHRVRTDDPELSRDEPVVVRTEVVDDGSDETGAGEVNANHPAGGLHLRPIEIGRLGGPQIGGPPRVDVLQIFHQKAEDRVGNIVLQEIAHVVDGDSVGAGSDCVGIALNQEVNALGRSSGEAMVRGRVDGIERSGNAHFYGR